MPHHLFQPQNAELLVAIARLSLKAIDRMSGALPPDEMIPAQEVSALMRLVGGALSYGVEAQRGEHREQEPMRRCASLNERRMRELMGRVGAAEAGMPRELFSVGGTRANDP